MPRPKTKPKAAAKRGPGQPEKELDLKQLALLCRMQCTDSEIAAYFSVSRKTIERRKLNEDFSEAMEHGKLKGLVSLRQAQFKAALAGNTTMLIWMGKQLLGQRDKSEPLPDANAPKPSIKIGLPDGGEIDAKPLNADSLISAGKVLPIQ